MQKLMKAMRKNEQGFTLVELMVVVVIIGILVAIAIPIFGNITAGAEQSAVEANLRTLDGAVMQYRAEHGQFPVGSSEVGAWDDVGLENYVDDFDSAGDETYHVAGSEAGEDNFGEHPNDVRAYFQLRNGEVGGHDSDGEWYLGNLPWNE